MTTDQRQSALLDALRDVLDLVRRQGGWLSPEDQDTLARCRTVYAALSVTAKRNPRRKAKR